jgi:hypothetical protein
MSDLSSAGIARGTPGYGTTCRKNVLRGVDIPVMPGAAGRTRPLPGRQAQLRQQVPARRARLRAGIPAADHDQLAAVPLALIGQLAAELTPAAVRDGAGQVPIADHAGHVQVLDHDHVVLADQAGAGAVQEVRPGVADLAVGAGDLESRLGPVGRALLAPGQPPLVTSQVPSLAVQVPLYLAVPSSLSSGSTSPVTFPSARSPATAVCHLRPSVIRDSGNGQGPAWHLTPSLRSQTWLPAAVIAPASDSQMPMVPCGQKPNLLNALLRVK